MAAVGKEIIKAVATTSNKTDISEARTIFALDTPIFYIIGWFVVAYFAVYFITFYAGPILFNTRPYRPFPYGRELNQVSRRSDSAEGSTAESTDFISRIMNSIENLY